ncbi:NEL-type E3 ubiquitin ligase domain-containing protein [Pseudomonas fontis]|uniref:RING-type E3 ubiquitin transferase n=1 Tax=Pseudomonas fontis TaxID=2942633 RepID=A0ABT5NUB4_9PSED|nr:NEL-type E3 ubiquitin ligase domain-containing protein [Pseudomonas fontis]MDD0973923.1 hypothetical protein [Pseudomonas fontis]MDD0991765.1 hypothetical protein [Pseudomonas fontis]
MPTPIPAVSSSLPADAKAIDQYLATQMPLWLSLATAQQLKMLRRSAALHHDLQTQVQLLMLTLQPLDAFAKPLLDDALRAHLYLALDVGKARWRDVRLKGQAMMVGAMLPPPTTYTLFNEDQALLARALQNFTEQQMSTSAHLRGSGILLGTARVEPRPEAFAALCRTLDLGGQYQQHLQQVFSTFQSPVGQSAAHLLAADKRCSLELQAHFSYLKGELNDSAYLMLLQACKDSQQSSYEGFKVRPVQLQLLGCCIHEAIVFEVLSPYSGGVGFPPGVQVVMQLVVYLPNAPGRPLRQFRSWAELDAALLQDLQAPAYQAWCLKPMNPPERLAFSTAYQLMLSEQRHALDAKGVALSEPLFTALAELQLARILSDAAQLAVPTAAVDQAAYQQRLKAIETAGLTLLGLVASFVPVLGEVMLASMVVQMLGEVYEGVEDWSHGRRHAALEHLLGLAENLTAMAALAAGGAAVTALLKRSVFVDQLAPVLRDDGSQRLWNADLEPYRSYEAPEGSEVNEQGLLSEGGRQWLPHADHHFEVQRHASTDQWRILHPQRPDAYAPWLEHNGESAWHLPGEHPVQWQGIAPLLQRISPLARNMGALECEQLAGIAGVDEALLRGLLVEGQRMPYGLRDCLALNQLDARVSAFIQQVQRGSPASELDASLYRYAQELLDLPTDPTGWPDQLLVSRARELFEHALVQEQPIVDAQAGLLLRDFSGLTPRAAQALLDQAPPEQLQRLVSEGRVPLELAEAARLAQRECRLRRALIGLKLRQGMHPNSARLVLGLLRRRPAWPAGLSLELREGWAGGRLIERQLALVDTRSVRVLVETAGGFDLYTEQGYALDVELAQPADLFDAISACLTANQRNALGWSGLDGAQRMRSDLLAEALGERRRCATVLGLPPARALNHPLQRSPEGHLGYPLSGRNSGLPSFAGIVRSLFPGLDDAQVEAFLQQLQGFGSNTLATLMRYQSAFRQLDATLTAWQGAASRLTRISRTRIAEALRRCWRRQADRVYAPDGSVMGYRLCINDISLADLPELPPLVDFAHVVDLNLAGTDLATRAERFLRAFTQVCWLDLSRCSLSELPANLGALRTLETLSLEGNVIQFSPAGVEQLLALSRLRILNLNGNPLGRLPDLRTLPELRLLRLRATQLQAVPEQLLGNPRLESVDLRDNLIHELPEALFAAPASVREVFILHDNPLSLGARERLLALQNVVVEVAEHVPFESARRLWLDAAPASLRTARAGLWQDLQAERGAQDFLRLMADLTATAEYRQAREYLAERVWKMLEGMAESTDIRLELFDLASSPTTCVDSVSSTFSMLEVRFLLLRAQAHDSTGNRRWALLRFARQLFRLDWVEHLARVQITQRLANAQLVDEVEVSLAYRTGLSRELELPGQPSHMLFRDIANVTPGDLERAAQAVRAAEASDQLAHYISTRDFWLDYLHDEHPTQFAELEQPFWDQLDVLTENPHGLPEGEYLQRINALRSQRETAVETLAHRLTLEALSAEADA